MGNMMDGNSMMGEGNAANIAGSLVELFFWVLIIIGVVLIIKWFVDQTKPVLPNDGVDAMEVLKLRYAKGEIDQKAFQSIRADLNRS